MSVRSRLLEKATIAAGKNASSKTFADAVTKHASRISITNCGSPRRNYLWPTLRISHQYSLRLTILVRHLCISRAYISIPCWGLLYCERL
jgi:hypothetical protein